jgi:asparagine synthase (glutamine-hydrolysing)
VSAALVLCLRADGIEPVRAEFDAVCEALPARVRQMPADEAEGRNNAVVRVWSHRESRVTRIGRDAESGSWLALLGNPTREDLTRLDGDNLLARLLDECLEHGADALDSLSPPFAAIFHYGRTGATTALADRCGLQHLYVSERDGGTTWVSSSSLALAAALGAHIDLDGAVEWLGIGHFVSQRTFFREIRKLACGERVAVEAGRVRSGGRWRPAPYVFDGDAAGAFADVFGRSVASAATGAPLAAEVTGGLDSRLVLAELLRSRAAFFGWTIGRPDSAELRTVERLRERAPFDHVTIDVDRGFGRRLPDLADKLHGLSDGEVSAFEYAPLLLAFERLDGMRTTSMSGSGGENARGYYYAALGHGSGPRGVPLNALVRKVTRDAGPLRAASLAALGSGRSDPVAAAVEAFVADSSGETPARILDDFYLRSRMQRFGGRNITTTGLFCRQGLPYFANAFVELAFSLPRELATDGRIVRETLMARAPQLAAVPLDSGIPAGPLPSRSVRMRLLTAVSKGRKGLVRYGGRVGRLVAAAPPDPVPWHAVYAEPVLREFVHDLLRSNETRVTALLPREAVDQLIASGLGRGDLYPLGLVLTLELTLRRTRAT